VGQRRGRTGRSAFGHHAGHVEAALQAADDRHDHNEEGDVGELRPGDVPEPLPRTRAVDVGRLVELLRNPGKSGEIEQHVVRTDRPPEPHDQQRGFGPVVIGNPLRRLESGIGSRHLRQHPEDAAESDQYHIEHHRRTVDDRRVADAAVGDAPVFPFREVYRVKETPPPDAEEEDHQQQHPVRIAAEKRQLDGSLNAPVVHDDVHPGRGDPAPAEHQRQRKQDHAEPGADDAGFAVPPETQFAANHIEEEETGDHQ